MPISPEQARVMRMSASDRRELAAVLYDTKRDVYVRTLNELADAHGYTGGAAVVALSRAVDRALRDEAADHAAKITDTFNAAFVEWARDLPVDIPPADAKDAYARWLDARNAWHAATVGVTEAATPHADAILAFYRDAGFPDAEYDFLTSAHGREAECELCRALIASNPHGAEEVQVIGNPHIQCQHTWQPRSIRSEDMPSRITVGRTPGGILGTEPFLHSFPSRRAAAEALRRPVG